MSEAGAPSRPDPIRAATEAMGTRFEVVIAETEAGITAACARAAAEEALAIVREWHDRLNAFSRDSITSLLNREAAERPVRTDSDFARFLRRCIELHGETGGAFDVATGALMRRWGFRGEPANETSRDREGAASSSPDPNRDRSLTVAARSDPGGSARGSAAIDLDDARETVRFAREGIALDFGAVAKGAALDEAREALIDAGVRAALIHGGTSTIVAIGAPPGTDAWNVALDEGGSAVVCLRDAALSVSRSDGRVAEQGGARHGHVLDPRTGAPARGPEAAACMSASGLETDAWSTALSVLGDRPAGAPEGMTTMVLDHGMWRVEGPGARCVRTPEGTHRRGRSVRSAEASFHAFSANSAPSAVHKEVL